ADRQRLLHLSDSNGVVSCFEHQRLSREDFAHAADFEYLIEQELPCFSIEVNRGQLSLVISHYLAKIILPSGLTLEILPKISVDEASNAKSNSSKSQPELAKRQADIVHARQWVAAMLEDISTDNL